MLDFFGVTAEDFPTVYVADQRNPNGMKKYSIASQSSSAAAEVEAEEGEAGAASDQAFNQLHSARYFYKGELSSSTPQYKPLSNNNPTRFTHPHHPPPSPHPISPHTFSPHTVSPPPPSTQSIILCQKRFGW